MSLTRLGVPNEILDKLSKENYVDREAKVRQHFRLLLVSRHWYNYFNSDIVWTGLFTLYYRPAPEISITFMRQFIRTKHLLKVHCKHLMLIRKKHHIGYNEKHPIKPHQVNKLRLLLKDKKVPSNVENDFVHHLNAIDEKKSLLSRMLRKNKNFKLTKS